VSAQVGSSCRGESAADQSTGGCGGRMRHYEMMVILDPQLDERTVAPSLDRFLGVVKTQGGRVNKVDVWGKRRLSYEIDKRTEGIYAVVDMSCTPATVAELDRQLSLSESVLRTKVLRRDLRKG
jgi:small subunit ribosomal protein S6